MKINVIFVKKIDKIFIPLDEAGTSGKSVAVRGSALENISE